VGRRSVVRRDRYVEEAQVHRELAAMMIRMIQQHAPEECALRDVSEPLLAGAENHHPLEVVVAEPSEVLFRFRDGSSERGKQLLGGIGSRWGLERERVGVVDL